MPEIAIDAVPAGLAIVGEQGRLLAANAALAAMVGRPLEDLIGRPMSELFTTAGRLLYQTHVGPMLQAQGRADQVAIGLRTPQGRLDALMNVAQSEEGGATRTTCVFMASGDRRGLENQLLTAQRVAEQAPGLLFQLKRTADGHYRFTYLTDVVRTLFEVSPPQALRSAAEVWQRVLPQDQPLLLQTLHESAQTLAPCRVAYRAMLSTGEAWRETEATPQREADGAVVWNGYTIDATERRLMEARLREQEAAERASRAKSEFLARVSHELRTPLNGILGFARLLQIQDAERLTDDQQRKLGYMETAGKALLQLINEVLDISRIEAGHMHVDPVDLAVDAIVSQALHLVEPMAQQRQARLIVLGDRGLWVRADEQRLLQVLVNLLSNALKYGPAGGRITLAVEDLGEEVSLAVLDEGPGLSAEQQAQLFQPFNRLGAERTAVEGAGLGLVITRGLVELMAGRIEVSSKAGRGACFKVTLPRVPSLAAGQALPVAPGPADAPSPPPGAGGPTAPRLVLYVEDNPVNVFLMESVFEGSRRYRLRVAESASDALTAVAQEVPDVILMDMHLPDAHGEQLLARLRTLPGLAAAPAIAVSADAMPTDIQRTLAAGFAAYWTKPLDVTRVLPALDELFQTAA